MNKKKREHKDQPKQEQQQSSFGQEEVSSEELSFKVSKKPDLDETAVLRLHRHRIQH